MKWSHGKVYENCLFIILILIREWVLLIVTLSDTVTQTAEEIRCVFDDI